MRHVDRRLAAADPLRHDLHALPDQAGQALLQEITMQPPLSSPEPAVKRRRSRLFVASAIIAGVIAIPSVAIGGVAVYDGLHSGMFGSGGESVAGEEFLYSDSPLIVAELQALTTDVRLPAGASYDTLLARYPMAERMLVQRSGLKSEVGFYAVCAWYQHWLAGDAATRSAAQPTIDAIPSWPYWNFAVDDGVAHSGVPTPAPLTSTEPGGGGSPFPKIAAQTRAGDATMLTQFVTANC